MYFRIIKEAFKYEELTPGCIYHVYNRANGSEKLFRDSGNYDFFLKKYRHYISPIAETFSFCLMPNHLHFLVRIKKKEEIEALFADKTSAKLPVLLTQQFSNLFNSYTKCYNKLFQRKGSLFIPKYKRKLVTSRNYLLTLIHYIHYNPVEAGLSRDLVSWPFSSYRLILEGDYSFVKGPDVIEWYDDLENFKTVHAGVATGGC
jgi:putative transposase